MPPHRRDGFLLAAACFLIGITFGVFADSSGLGLGQASVLSVFTFTGASQFALVSVAAGGGTSVAAVGSRVHRTNTTTSTRRGTVSSQGFARF